MAIQLGSSTVGAATFQGEIQQLTGLRWRQQ